MADESSIRATLVAYAGLTALIGGAVAPRLWDQLLPTSVGSPAPRPYVIMTTNGDNPEGFAASAPGIALFQVQFDVYADTKADAKAVLEQMRAALLAAGWTDSEQVSRDMPSGDPALRRIESEWEFWIPR